MPQPTASPLQSVPSSEEIRNRLEATHAERRALKDLLKVALQIENAAKQQKQTATASA